MQISTPNKVPYWTKEGGGFKHKNGYVLEFQDSDGVLKIGGVWKLKIAGCIIDSYYFTYHFTTDKLFRWASEEIKNFESIYPVDKKK